MGSSESKNIQQQRKINPTADTTSTKLLGDDSADRKRQVFTNLPMIVKNDDPKSKEYKVYLPCHMGFKFKNFNKMQLSNLSSEVDAELTLTIMYGQLASEISQLHSSRMNTLKVQVVQQKIQEVLSNDIVLLFPRDSAIQLSEKLNQDQQISLDCDIDFKRKLVTFNLVKNFNLFLDSNITMTPFQLIFALIEITMMPVTFKFQNRLIYKIHFNLMYNTKPLSNITFYDRGILGSYDLAEAKMRAKYTNYRIDDHKEFYKTPTERIQEQMQMEKKKNSLSAKIEQQQKNPRQTKWGLKRSKSKKQKKPQVKAEQFHYANFNVPFYKKPMSSVLTIFLPLFCLDILSYGIYFQNAETINDRVAAIAAIVFAYIAMIPTIRKQIPPSPDILIVEILVYFQAATTLLALIQSLYANGKVDYHLTWGDSAFLIVGIAVSVITFVLLLVKTIYYYAVEQPSYNRVSSRFNESFKKILWQNEECDYYFSKKFWVKRTRKIIWLYNKKTTKYDPNQKIQE